MKFNNYPQSMFSYKLTFECSSLELGMFTAPQKVGGPHTLSFSPPFFSYFSCYPVFRRSKKGSHPKTPNTHITKWWNLWPDPMKVNNPTDMYQKERNSFQLRLIRFLTFGDSNGPTLCSEIWKRHYFWRSVGLCTVSVKSNTCRDYTKTSLFDF